MPAFRLISQLENTICQFSKASPISHKSPFWQPDNFRIIFWAGQSYLIDYISLNLKSLCDLALKQPVSEGKHPL
jgi:hypothetical protein